MTEKPHWTEGLKNARVMLWVCVNHEHTTVTWTGTVATCDQCGLTSEMTGRWIKMVQRETLRQMADEIDRTYPAERWRNLSQIEQDALQQVVTRTLGAEVGLINLVAQNFRTTAEHLRLRAEEMTYGWDADPSDAEPRDSG